MMVRQPALYAQLKEGATNTQRRHPGFIKGAIYHILHDIEKVCIWSVRLVCYTVLRIIQGRAYRLDDWHSIEASGSIVLGVRHECCSAVERNFAEGSF